MQYIIYKPQSYKRLAHCSHHKDNDNYLMVEALSTTKMVITLQYINVSHLFTQYYILTIC